MKTSPLLRAVSCAAAVLLLPGVASAALSLDFEYDPIRSPRQFDLVFHETGAVQREGLFTYDIGLNLIRPGGVTGGVNFVTGPGAVALGPNNVFNTGNPPSIQISESTPSRLLFNVTSAGDLNDIDDGEGAARVFFTVAPETPWGLYRFQFDRDNSVFGSGDPELPLSIEVDLSDELRIIIPEPSALSLLAGAALLGLRRRRR